MNNEVLDSEDISIAVGNSKNVSFDGVFPSIEKGSTVTFSIEAELTTDENPDDNSASFDVLVNETFAWDNCNYWEGGVGSNSANFGLGEVYTLTKTDVLKSVSVVWIAKENDEEFILNVFKIGENLSIGEPIISKTVTRPKMIQGSYEYEIEPVSLEPGYYYFEVFQTGAANIMIAYDRNPKGNLYIRDADGAEIEAYSNPAWGYIGVRANFVATTVGINNIDSDINVFVANEVLYVNADAAISNIVINDIKGSMIYASGNINDTKYDVSVGRLSKGVYVASVTTAKGTKNIKFVIR